MKNRRLYPALDLEPEPLYHLLSKEEERRRRQREGRQEPAEDDHLPDWLRSLLKEAANEKTPPKSS